MDPKISAKTNVTGIILAGGRSSRFGRDKAFELIDRESLIERAVRSLAGLSELMVVTNKQLAPQMAPDLLGARVILDVKTGQGPLGGIHAGLLSASNRYSVMVACDMPFLNRDLLWYMLSLCPGHDVVIPRVSGMLEPLHAVYSKNCLPAIERNLDQGRRVAYSFLDHVRVRFVEQYEIDRFDPRHLSFSNVNSPADMEEAREIASKLKLEMVGS